MKMMEPIQVLLIFMQSMDLLLAKTPPEDVKSDVLPMLYRALGKSIYRKYFFSSVRYLQYCLVICRLLLALGLTVLANPSAGSFQIFFIVIHAWRVQILKNFVQTKISKIKSFFDFS